MRAVIFCLLFALVAFSQATSQVMIREESPEITPKELGCDACVSFMNQAVGQILQIIEQVGILGSCAEVCQALPNQYLAIACDIFCEYEGKIQ